jgi:hypothetical protein
MFSWSKFSEAVEKYFQAAPGVSCIFGPMDAEIKARKAPVRRDRKKPVGEARRAEEVVEQEVDKQVLKDCLVLQPVPSLFTSGFHLCIAHS